MAATAWGQVYADANFATREPSQGTVRVELKDMAMSVFSNSQHRWVAVESTPQVSGTHYVDNFSGNSSIGADWQTEPDGGISSSLVAGYNVHFWPTGSRASLPIAASDIGAVYTTVQARLIGANVASAHYLLNVGGDWWQTPTAAYPNNSQIGQGRFMYLSGNWAAYDFWTGGAYRAAGGWSDAQMAANGAQRTLMAIAATPGGGGVWGADASGGVMTAGDATKLGALGLLAAPIVGIAPTKSGQGYWLAGGDGGVFSFGDARFLGSAGGTHLRSFIVGMAATPDGGGYWLVAADGGVFTYGDARFFGSAGALRLRQPIMGMAATPDGGGYWLVAADGGVFTYGDARFFGSAGATGMSDASAIAATPSGGGYWVVGRDGSLMNFGDAAKLALQ